MSGEGDAEPVTNPLWEEAGEMAEQILINIVRPEVGVEYRPESLEAQPEDALAAYQLGMHALARQVQMMCRALSQPCPEAVETVVRSDLWRNGM